MPTGYPKSRALGLGPSENTQRLMASMKELAARIAAERRKDKARVLLVSFALKHNLSAADLRHAATVLADRKVGDAPVMSLAMGRKSSPRADKSKPAKGRIGKAIRAARMKAGLTDEQLGQRLGVSKTPVNVWQSKGRPVPEHLQAKLIEVLKLPKGLFRPNGHAEAG